MPVALAQHMDRWPDKMLLTGTVCRVHSWDWPDNDRLAHRLPRCVYVKFEGATWQLDGIDEPGVYPIRPWKEDWFLDGKRNNPVLKVKRQQIPLTPAFAITAHSSQGKTLRALYSWTSTLTSEWMRRLAQWASAGSAAAMIASSSALSRCGYFSGASPMGPSCSCRSSGVRTWTWSPMQKA